MATGLQISHDDTRTTVEFRGTPALTHTNVEAVCGLLHGLIRPRWQLLLDLAAVEDVCSAWFAALVRLNGHARTAGGRLTLRNPRPQVREAMAAMGLDRLLDVRHGGSQE
jgi:anti-anti-sigma regulatory factor